jgi:hypothetical protein
MDWTPYFSDSPERLAAWEFRVWVVAVILGALAIVLGFVARDIAGHRSAVLQRRLNETTTALNDRTTELNQTTIELNEKTTTLERMARTTEQKVHAAAEMRQAPRIINEVQAKEFLATLAAAPKGNLEFMYPGGDPEVEALSEKIEQLLWTAGWTTSGSVLISSETPVGLKLIVSGREATSPQGVALKRALKAVGLPASEQVDSRRPPGSLLLVIGVTPKQVDRR